MGKVEAIVVAVAGGFFALAVLAFLSGRTESELPRPAPVLELASLDGAGFDLAALRGQPVLLNFWATWCPPCVAETPSLVKLDETLRPEGLVVVGLSVDKDRDAVRNFVQRFGIRFPIPLDPTARSAHRYGTFKYPETFFIDRTGNIVKHWIGPVEWTRPEVLAEVRGLMRTGRSAAAAPR